jgi:hypothetical protein
MLSIRRKPAAEREGAARRSLRSRVMVALATVLTAFGAVAATAGTAEAATPRLRFFYSYDYTVTSIGAAPVHASFDDAFRALHACFNCSFPVPGAPAEFPAEGQLLPLKPCLLGPIGCVDAPVRSYARDQNGYLEFIAQPGHFDGAGSTITFRFHTDSAGVLHLNVTAFVATQASTAFPPDSVNRQFASTTWGDFARNIGDFIYLHVCGSLNCPPPPSTPTGSATPCSQLNAVVCTGGTATVLDPTCPGGSKQWLDATDLNNVPIHYTFANDTRACMRVRYDMYPTTTTCAFWMYVPKKYATGDITFGWWDTNGDKHYWWINENAVDGWQYIFSASMVTRIEWQDNNGQFVNSTALGWSSEDEHGFAQRC